MTRNNLEKVLLLYKDTKDGSLITEEIYLELIKLTKYIMHRYVDNEMFYDDELMSIVNYRLWDKIDKYKPDKGSGMINYISIIIKHILITEYKKQNIEKRKTPDNMIYLDAEIRSKPDKVNNNTNYKIIGIDGKVDSGLHYKEIINIMYNAFDYVKQTRKGDIYDHIEQIYIACKIYGYKQKDVAKKYGYSRENVARAISNANKQIISDLQLHGYVY